MDDLRFRELYEEAKMHLQHANLTNLISRAKKYLKVSEEKFSSSSGFFIGISCPVDHEIHFKTFVFVTYLR